MAEINVKSPHLKQRDVDTIVIHAKVTIDATCSVIDIPGFTLSAAGTADSSSCDLTITLSAVEPELDLALDESRDASFVFKSYGTLGACAPTRIEAANLLPISGAVSADPCSNGSRTVAFVFGLGVAGAFVASTDTLTDAEVEIHLPVKAKDFVIP